MKPSVKSWLDEQMAGIDQETIAEIYAEYKATANKLHSELVEKVATSAEFEVVDRIAHTLKGNAAMVGDQALFDAVQGWRAAMANGDKAAADKFWPVIAEEVRTIE